MDVRPLRPNESGNNGFIKSPNEMQELSIPARGLFDFLLRNGAIVSGPIEHIGHGLSRRGALVAAEELRQAGLLGYEHVRLPDGTTIRVPWVTAIPGVIPEGVARRVTAMTQPRNRISAGQTKTPHGGFGVTSRNNASSQVAPSAQSGVLVPPAETHPADGISAGQAGSPSRAPLPLREEEDHPLPPPPAVPGPREHELVEVDEASQRQAQQRAYLVHQRLPRGPKQLGMSPQERARVLPYIAAKLLEGCTESEIVDHLSDLPPKGVSSPVPFVIAKLARLDPPASRGQAPIRPTEQRIEDLTQRLEREDVGLYARQGDRPGVVDVGQVDGGWREVIRSKQQDR